VPYFKEIGFSSSVAASAISVYGGASLVARFFWGYLADKYSIRHAIVLQGALTAGAALSLLVVTNEATLYVTALYGGACLGGFPILQSLVWPFFFGRRYLGSIMGVTQLFMSFANAGGPVLAGLLSDATGTYESAIWLLLLTWGVCVGVMLLIRTGSASRPAIEVATAPAGPV
jgi:MFS family permease